MILPEELLALATKKELGFEDTDAIITGIRAILDPIVGVQPEVDGLHHRIVYVREERGMNPRCLTLLVQISYLAGINPVRRRFLANYNLSQHSDHGKEAREGYWYTNSLPEILDYFLEKHENLTAEWTLGSLA